MAENDKIFDENGCVVKKDKEKEKEQDEKGFNTRSYINLLSKKVIPSLRERYFNDLSNLIYIRDNSRVHSGKNLDGLNEKELLEVNNLELENQWPSYSPDLNPVENLWALIDREKCKILDKIDKDRYPKNKEEGFKLIKKAYDNVKNEDVINCYNSFFSRLRLLILKEGNNDFDYSNKRFKLN